MGFTLREIASLLNIYYSGELSVQEQQEILNDKLLLVEQKIQNLEEVKASIQNKLCMLRK